MRRFWPYGQVAQHEEEEEEEEEEEVDQEEVDEEEVDEEKDDDEVDEEKDDDEGDVGGLAFVNTYGLRRAPDVFHARRVPAVDSGCPAKNAGSAVPFGSVKRRGDSRSSHGSSQTMSQTLRS